MTDTTTAEAAAPVLVPITKGGPKATVSVLVDNIPNDMYLAIVELGLKTALNGGAGKVTKEAYPDETERHAKAMEIAQKRVDEMMAGKLKLGRKTAEKGPSGPIMTEARVIARAIVKKRIKDSGGKVTHYAASAITAAANELIAEDPSIIAQAEKNLASRGKLEGVSIDTLSKIVGKMSKDANKVAKDEAAKKDKPLSATQASKAKTHAPKSGAKPGKESRPAAH